MRAHPDDLTTLLRGFSPDEDKEEHGPRYGLLGWSHAFLKVCNALEPGFAFKDSTSRMDWLEKVSFVDAKLKRWEHPYSEGDRSLHTRDRAADRDQGPPLGIDFSVFRRLEQLALENWIGPSPGMAAELAFMTDADYKRIAERDLVSLANALKSDDVKMSVAIAGFVVEAILCDQLERDRTATQTAAVAAKAARGAGRNFDPAKPDEWKFIHKIVICGHTGLKVLSERVEDAAQTARDWRNLVHPKEEKALGAAQLTPSDATIARGLMEKVIEEVDAYVRASVPAGAALPAPYVLPW